MYDKNVHQQQKKQFIFSDFLELPTRLISPFWCCKYRAPLDFYTSLFQTFFKLILTTSKTKISKIVSALIYKNCDNKRQ